MARIRGGEPSELDELHDLFGAAVHGVVPRLARGTAEGITRSLLAGD